MTKAQLEKGNQLSNQIEDLEVSRNKVQDCLKELELDRYKGHMSSISIDRTNCVVNQKRLTAFLWDELKTLEQEINESKNELESL